MYIGLLGGGSEQRGDFGIAPIKLVYRSWSNWLVSLGGV